MDDDRSPDASAHELDRLRNLLIKQEIEQIEQLSGRLDDASLLARDVSRSLPEAIALRAGKDKKLVSALMPTVEEILHSSVERDPHKLSRALFPVMGPAIRKAIAEAIRSMVQSFNHALEHSFSLQGLKWRLLALRTGKSFAEIVLLHSLVYRVEQVFLIHADTGLLLQHAVAEDVTYQDADMVSGMFTAIQDFVRDSFDPDAGDSLDTLRIGELTIVVERGASAYLAAVVRGEPPEELQYLFRDALDAIVLEKGSELAVFSGDAAPFEVVRHHLEDCLLTRYREQQHKSFPYFRVLLLVLFAALLVWAGFAVRDQLAWNALEERFAQEPGYVLLDSDESRRTFKGLRDPLARSPQEVLAGAKKHFSGIRFEFAPYQALSTEFVLKRVREALRPPETVHLALSDDGRLHATGSATLHWIHKAKEFAPLLPGINRVRLDIAEDTDPLLPHWEKYLQLLADTPGIEITSSGRRAEKYFVTGFRDPLALDPESLLDKAGLQTETVAQHWASFQSLDPAIVLKRAYAVLEPPESVELQYADEILSAGGSAPHDWLMKAERLAPSIVGVTRYLDAAVVDSDLEELQPLIEGIESAWLLFKFNTTHLLARQEKILRRIGTQALALQRLLMHLDMTFHLEVIGHADNTGEVAYNLALAEKRAITVKDFLITQGVSSTLLITRSAIPRKDMKGLSEEQLQMDRRVSLRVVLLNQSAGVLDNGNTGSRQ